MLVKGATADQSNILHDSLNVSIAMFEEGKTGISWIFLVIHTQSLSTDNNEIIKVLSHWSVGTSHDGLVYSHYEEQESEKHLHVIASLWLP